MSGLTLASLAGCDLDDLRAPRAVPTVDPSASATSTPETDETLVAEVLGRLASARSVAAGGAAVPRLATLAAPLVALHDAHLAVLTPSGGPSTAAGSPSGSASGTATPVPAPAPDVSLPALRRSETALQQQLAAAAVRAANAELAQLLASMSAAVAQRVALLPARVAS